MFQQFDVALSIPSEQIQISIFIANLWDSTLGTYTNATYVPQVKGLADNIDLLSSDYYFLTTAMRKYSQNLQYNNQNPYNFVINKAVNGQISPLNITMSGNDGLNNFIAASSYFINNKTTDKVFLQQESLYILYNGLDTIPSISTNAVELYYRFYIQYCNNQLQIILYLKIILLFISVIGILALAPLGKKLNIVNIEVVDLYNSIKLWDINEILLKCLNFLEFRGQKIAKKARGQSLLKIFPNKTYLQIIQQQKYKDSVAMNTKSSKKSQ